MSTDLDSWWSELSAAALVGTARRRVPALPEVLGGQRPGATREVGLLDGAALGSAVRLAGVVATQPEPVDAAADDVRAEPTLRAVQLLELLLLQSPIGAALKPDLVRLWLHTAQTRGQRAPHHLLPELLRLATGQKQLRSDVRRVGDARAAWLARSNPEWGWAVENIDQTTTPAPMDPAGWARLPADERAAEVVRLRRTDPGIARELVESTWRGDAAVDRATLLSALRSGIGADDELLLERSLDDRSQKVREVGVSLLDALPASARAARMADRLRPLLHFKGLLRRQLQVELPTDPDDTGVRDGLTRPKAVGSVRGWWLQRIAAGAPLDVWTDVSGSDPKGTWRLITEQDARAGLVEAVLARRDRAWATVIVADVWHPGLLALLPVEQLDTVATRQLTDATTAQVVAVVRAVPKPWGPAFSRAVIRVLMSEKDASLLLSLLWIQLATSLDGSARPSLETWVARLDGSARERVSTIHQYLSLLLEIPEAFR